MFLEGSAQAGLDPLILLSCVQLGWGGRGTEVALKPPDPDAKGTWTEQREGNGVAG